ncbi:MAG: hypothetical protein ACPG8W_01120 [Candidatus Promineifilaceae bacterium]
MAKRKRMSVFAQTEESSESVAAEKSVSDTVPHETNNDAVAAEFWGIVNQVSVPNVGRSSSIGVGLKPDEHILLNDIAQQTGAARNALVRYAVRKFIQMYQSEMIEIEFEKPSPYSPPTVYKKIKI